MLNHRTNFGALQEEEIAAADHLFTTPTAALKLIAIGHPGVFKMIRHRWGTRYLNDALNRMILQAAEHRKMPDFMERRETIRKPFTMEEAMALMTILETHEKYLKGQSASSDK